jgi:hypothetical protein
MGLVTVAVTICGIVGPIAHARMTRVDRQIESGLTVVSGQVNAYTNLNKKLPGSLNDIRSKLSGDAATIVDQNLVEYKPGKMIGLADLKAASANSSLVAYEYELCVTYKEAQGGANYYEDYNNGRPTMPSTYSHDAGHVCYPLQTRYAY